MENLNKKNQETLVSDKQVPLIVFKLGEEEYAIKIEQVKEVTITPGITVMPKTPKFIKGVANIRGDIIAIMDLEERFNISKTGNAVTKLHTYTLVVEKDNFSIGIVVREVPQTLTLFATQIEKTPGIIQDYDVNEKYIEGIGKINGRLIIILDIYKILTFEEEQELKLNQEG